MAGRKLHPTLIDRIQDRYGRTIYKHDSRICDGCTQNDWDGQSEPTLIDNREQVLDPMTAYQITSMMEGVVQRGTATSVRAVNRPVAGKTGTTNDEKDAWFVGYTPDLAVGVFVGFDNPKPMGRGATGGQVAAPIFTEFVKQALAEKPPVEFRVPRGLQLIPINKNTGLRTAGGTPGTRSWKLSSRAWPRRTAIPLSGSRIQWVFQPMCRLKPTGGSARHRRTLLTIATNAVGGGLQESCGKLISRSKFSPDPESRLRAFHQ
jgi:membrane carboxypeptidase/penicillin-binding protein